MSLLRAAFKKSLKGFSPKDWPQLSVQQTLSVNKQNHFDYCQLCGFSEGGLAPTYPIVMATPLVMNLLMKPQHPFKLLGMVHLSNRLIQYRRIGLDEILDFDVSLGALSEHKKGWVFEVIIRVQVSGELVSEVRMTNLAPAKMPDSEFPKADLLAEFDVTNSETVSLDGALGRQYAKVSGDYNPIHLYPLTAKLFGFKRHIIHGLWSKAFCLAKLNQSYCDKFCCKVDFKKPLFLPAEIAFASRQGGTDNPGVKFKLYNQQHSILLGEIKPLEELTAT